MGIAANTNDDFENAAVRLRASHVTRASRRSWAKTQDLIVFGLKIRFNGDPVELSALASAGFNGEGKWRRVVASHLLQGPAPRKELLPIALMFVNRYVDDS